MKKQQKNFISFSAGSTTMSVMPTGKSYWVFRKMFPGFKGVPFHKLVVGHF